MVLRVIGAEAMTLTRRTFIVGATYVSARAAPVPIALRAAEERQLVPCLTGMKMAARPLLTGYIFQSGHEP